MVQLLLGAGAAPDARDGAGGRTALLHAAEVGALGVVAALLRAGASACAADDRGVTPLALAAKGGFERVAAALVAAGAKADAVDARGRGALWCAVTAGHTALVTLLIAAGAPADAVAEDGESLVERADRARMPGRAAIIAALVAAGASDVGLGRNLRDGGGYFFARPGRPGAD
jgi:ankyrin repeat protein